ncbi:MAG: SCO family protein, partial [Gammaproteobacteria bacterium]
MIVAWLVLQNIDSLKPAGSRNFGQLIEPPRPLTNFVLQDATGEKFDRDSVQGHWSVFYFGQSDCDAICQETVSKIHQARLAQGKEMRRLRLYYITSDAASLNEGTQAFIQPFWGISVVSGEVANVNGLREQFAATGSLPDEAGR